MKSLTQKIWKILLGVSEERLGPAQAGVQEWRAQAQPGGGYM